MPIIEHSTRPVHHLPGISHQTTAGYEHGLKGLEVWVQTLEPGATTPEHYHDCEETVVVLSGSGGLIAQGEEMRFGPDCTLAMRPYVVHRLINDGTGPMRLVVALSASPNRVFAPDGTPITLPWTPPNA